MPVGNSLMVDRGISTAKATDAHFVLTGDFRAHDFR